MPSSVIYCNYNNLIYESLIALITIRKSELNYSERIIKVPKRKELRAFVEYLCTLESGFTRRDLSDLLQHLKSNKEDFMSRLDTKPRRTEKEFDISEMDTASLTREWLEGFRTFGKELIEMR